MTADAEGQKFLELGEIDRTSPIPLYHQLEYLLRRDIEAGRYRPGDTLPSEGEICARYEVSRSVVRQTLTNLTHAGLIRTERGRGSFVAEKKLHERFVQRTTGLYDDLRRRGYEIRTHVVRQVVAELPLPVQEFLQTEEGVQIDRVRSVDGRVLTFIRSFIPASACPGLEHAELEDRSLYKVLSDDYGREVASGRRTVEAVKADGEVARHLGVDEGEPLLLLRSSSRDKNGEPFEWFEAWHRGDRTMFEIEIVPGAADQPFSSVVRPEADTPSTKLSEASTPPEASMAAPAPAPAVPLADTMRHAGVVAVLRAAHYSSPAAVARVLAQHGLQIVEITLSGGNALDAVADARTVENVLVGAGTVTSAQHARDAIAAGAQFLVAPAGAHDVLSAAGTTPVIFTGFTLNEIWSAWLSTSAPVKVFPASVGGPGYVSTLHSQISDVPLLAAGGVSAGDAASYVDAGAVAVAVGESLCPSDALQSGDLDAIADHAARFRDALTPPPSFPTR
ncbi:UTRA domain-containing protein [Phytoactinopolyspora halophila]|uniref:UTRA domain-containing protein n=1 Tax=Phytoactinopolyspora halophila TaxID=1981511 RepID=UPI001314E85A|nr:UTRA domain-containing protein [Phytoactinopolyspora halophila]